MEVIFGLVVLTALFFIILLFVLAYQVTSLNRKFRRLKAELDLLKSGIGGDRPKAGPEQRPDQATSPAAETASPDKEAPAAVPPEYSGATAEVPETPAATAGAPGRETLIGGKWTVWAGGVTLALGGVFLVKYAIENSILGPEARLLLGALFGLVLLAASEWSRRKPGQFSLPGFEVANIPATLTAAGTVALYSVTYAAHGLYGFIGPGPAFLLLGALALMTMLAALLHGAGLAALGILGSYVVPFMVNAPRSALLPVVLYVLAVSAAGVAIGRFRLWLWLAGSAIAGLIGYGLLFEIAAANGDRLLLILYAAGGIAIAYFGFVWKLHPADPQQTEPVDYAATVVLSIFALPLAAHVQFPHAGGAYLAEAVLLIVLPFAAVYFHSALRLVLFAPLLAALWSYYRMGVPLNVTDVLVGPDYGAWPGIITPLPAEYREAFSEFSLYGACAALFMIALAAVGSWRSAARTYLASGAALGALGLLSIAYLRVESWQVSWSFAGLALAIGIAFFVIADRLKRGAGVPEGEGACVAAWLVGALSALTLAACFALEEAALTVALGLLVPAFAVVYRRYPEKALRFLTAFAVIPYVLRLIWDPFIVGEALGTTPFFNALLYGYGVPCLGFVLSAYLLTARGHDNSAGRMQAIAIVSVVITLAILALHWVDPHFRFDAWQAKFQAAAMLVIIGGAVSLGLTRFLPGERGSVLEQASIWIGAAGMVYGALELFVEFNPLVTGAPVGEGIFVNWVSFAYGLPFLLFGILARQAWRVRPKPYVMAVAIFSAAMGFAFVNLTIRNIFSPDHLVAVPVSDLENYVYSIVWLVVGVACLLAGLVRNSLFLRQVSGAVIGLVVLKVFLIDMSALEGVLRALSFIGLGLTLIGIGYLYQRMLLRPSAETRDSEAGAADF
ncbi:DUF2339 domain-containing protein [Roseibium aggregatum]|uniref:DUF2339 domain-containing protein n=1 Tax=Roseibium aggregatum TaxID=187304 RepID=A0A926NW41_9HYPH|nr:DUF2339 domain-containing protein [Roseibium aggregatum]MBD1547459.1 DUF2339 domain-containing protein [Roseibium aggregatum]